MKTEYGIDTTYKVSPKDPFIAFPNGGAAMNYLNPEVVKRYEEAIKAIIEAGDSLLDPEYRKRPDPEKH